MLLVLLAYATGAFGAGYVAAKTAKDQQMLMALIAGFILLIFGVVNLMEIPHPLWFAIASLILYLPIAWLGSKLVR
jgi:hypothetical protein